MFLPLEAYEPAAAGLGAAGGAGILGGALGLAGQALSAPRRMLWGALGLPDSGSEVLHQYAGMDPNSAWTKALGLGVEMAGDPLTWLGEGLGGVTGALKGAGFGADLAGQAIAKGPQYAGDLEKLADAAAAATPRGTAFLDALKGSDQADRVLSEIPEGSKLLGRPNNAAAWRTPEGDVVRVGTEAGRANVPQMLPPTRSVRAGPFLIERAPFADRVGDLGLYGDSYSDLASGIRQAGGHPSDLTPPNIGEYGGQPVVIDPGAIVPHPRAATPISMYPEIQAQTPGGVRDWLLRALGSDQAVRERLLQQASY